MKSQFVILLGVATALSICLNFPSFAQTQARRSYDFSSFLEAIKQHHKGLKLARQDVFLAKAAEKEALSMSLPKLYGQGQYRRNLQEEFLFFTFTDPRNGEKVTEKYRVSFDNSFRFNAVLEQTLLSFKNIYALQAAHGFREVSNLSFQSKYQEIITLAKQVYIQTQFLKKATEVQQANEAFAKRNYDWALKQFQYGLISELDLLQAELMWKNSIPETLKAERNYILAKNQLKTLIGISPSDSVTFTFRWELPGVNESEGTFKSVILRRPDYQLLLAQRKLSRKNLQLKQAGRLPSLKARLLYSYSTLSNEWNLNDNSNKTLVLGVSLNIPIFTGFNTSAQVQKARIQVEKANLHVLQAEEQMDNQCTGIMLRLQEAVQRVLFAQRSLEVAERALNLAEQNARTGLISQLALSESQKLNKEAFLNYYYAIYEHYKAYFDWEKAFGQINNEFNF